MFLENRILKVGVKTSHSALFVPIMNGQVEDGKEVRQQNGPC